MASLLEFQSVLLLLEPMSESLWGALSASLLV